MSWRPVGGGVDWSWVDMEAAVLARWRDDPSDVPAAGRRLTCFWSDNARVTGVGG